MELDAIMGKIRDGLTGDTERDIRYLEKCAEMYRNHPLHLEIARGMRTDDYPNAAGRCTERDGKTFTTGNQRDGRESGTGQFPSVSEKISGSTGDARTGCQGCG